MIQQTVLSLTASDATGQRRIQIDDVSLDASVGEVLRGITPALNLARSGSDGQELVVEARLERESRYLSRSEKVRDALRHGDHLVLQPRIMAGASAQCERVGG